MAGEDEIEDSIIIKGGGASYLSTARTDERRAIIGATGSHASSRTMEAFSTIDNLAMKAFGCCAGSLSIIPRRKVTHSCAAVELTERH